MKWNEFFDYVLPELNGIAQPLAEHYLRQAAIEFCDMSNLYIVDFDLIDVVAGQSTYPLVAPALSYPVTPPAVAVQETEFSIVRAAWFDGTPLAFATLETLNAGMSDWANVDGDRPIAFTQFSQDALVLYPRPRASLLAGLKIQAAIRPTRNSTGIVDWIGSGYFDTIAKGAMGKLMLQPGKPWTNVELGSHYTSVFEAGKGDAAVNTNRSNTRATLSVQMRPAVISGRHPVMRR